MFLSLSFIYFFPGGIIAESNFVGSSSPSLLTSLKYIAITNSCKSKWPSLSISLNSHIFLNLLVGRPVDVKRDFAPDPDTNPSLLIISNCGLYIGTWSCKAQVEFLSPSASPQGLASSSSPKWKMLRKDISYWYLSSPKWKMLRKDISYCYLSSPKGEMLRKDISYWHSCSPKREMLIDRYDFLISKDWWIGDDDSVNKWER